VCSSVVRALNHSFADLHNWYVLLETALPLRPCSPQQQHRVHF